MPAGRMLLVVSKFMRGQGQLLQIIGALGASGGLSGTLHGRQQQGDEHADDRDDHEQFNERKAASG